MIGVQSRTFCALQAPAHMLGVLLQMHTCTCGQCAQFGTCTRCGRGPCCRQLHTGHTAECRFAPDFHLQPSCMQYRRHSRTVAIGITRARHHYRDPEINEYDIIVHSVVRHTCSSIFCSRSMHSLPIGLVHPGHFTASRLITSKRTYVDGEVCVCVCVCVCR